MVQRAVHQLHRHAAMNPPRARNKSPLNLSARLEIKRSLFQRPERRKDDSIQGEVHVVGLDSSGRCGHGEALGCREASRRPEGTQRLVGDQHRRRKGSQVTPIFIR
jgi:hypothetical protein